MRKWEKVYSGIIVGLFLFIFIIAFIVKENKDRIPANIFELLEMITIVDLLLLLLLPVGYFIAWATLSIRKGLHNIKKFDDEVFQEIDRYKNCWQESNEGYIRQIQIIKLTYRENGEVDKLVKNRELGRLFARADYLSVKSNLFEGMTTLILSMGTSVIASFVIKMMKLSNAIYFVLSMIAIMFLFLLIALLKYAQRGQAGSYRYFIDEYEKELLLLKIKHVEAEIKCTSDEREGLETKQVVIEALTKILKDKKKRKKKEDIRIVERLKLSLDNYDNCYKRKIQVGGKICYLLYDMEKGKENKYVGELNLISDEFVSLYKMLEKYELIQCI